MPAEPIVKNKPAAGQKRKPKEETEPSEQPAKKAKPAKPAKQAASTADSSKADSSKGSKAGKKYIIMVYHTTGQVAIREVGGRQIGSVVICQSYVYLIACLLNLCIQNIK